MNKKKITEEEMEAVTDAVQRMLWIAQEAMASTGRGAGYQRVVEHHLPCLVEVIRTHLMRIATEEVTVGNADAGLADYVAAVAKLVDTHAGAPL